MHMPYTCPCVVAINSSEFKSSICIISFHTCWTRKQACKRKAKKVCFFLFTQSNSSKISTSQMQMLIQFIRYSMCSLLHLANFILLKPKWHTSFYMMHACSTGLQTYELFKDLKACRRRHAHMLLNQSLGHSCTSVMYELYWVIVAVKPSWIKDIRHIRRCTPTRHAARI